MTDNCNTTKSGRKKYERKSGVAAIGCSSHGANGMNKGVFKLEDNSQVQDRMDQVQNGIKGTQFGAFVKKEIATDEVIEEMKKKDPNLDMVQKKQEIDKKVVIKMDHKSFGIPSAGKTRHWNNQYKIIDWQLKHKHSILRLYVFFTCSVLLRLFVYLFALLRCIFCSFFGPFFGFVCCCCFLLLVFD